MQIRDTSVIGCYYSPITELEDLISDFLQALDKIETSNIMVGGDFNIKPKTIGCMELSKTLANLGIGIQSDTNIATYTYSKGRSTLDYIFSSYAMGTIKVVIKIQSLVTTSSLQRRYLFQQINMKNQREKQLGK